MRDRPGSRGRDREARSPAGHCRFSAGQHGAYHK